ALPAGRHRRIEGNPRTSVSGVCRRTRRARLCRPGSQEGFPMNVVRAWRDRARGLRAEFPRCDACGTFALALRLVCARCGASMANASTARLPRHVRGLGYSHAHLIVETMDQRRDRHPAMLVETPQGQKLALLLCETDSALGPRLAGEDLEIAMRRTGD